MGTFILRNASFVLPDEVIDNAALAVRDGEITEILTGGGGDGEEIDLGGATVYPGFIDVHIHGAVGVDTNAADAGDLRKLAGFLAANGVTAWLPTIVPDSDQDYRRVVEEVDALIESGDDDPVARAVGIHYEGVFANEKMCGALRPEYFKKFTGSEVAELPRLRNGAHMITIAPEVEGGIELIRELCREGWTVSIGHTKADGEILNAAFAAGARHLTHFYNAMTGLHHREVGVVGWAFSKSEVTFDIIADGVHVHPDMLRFACLSKGANKVSLISDAVLPTGMGDGEFEIWGEQVSVVEGRTQNERGSIAGSVITMRDAAKRMLSLGFFPPDVARMASLNPAKLLGIDDSYGSIEIGKRADLVALNENGEVVMTMIGGKIVK